MAKRKLWVLGEKYFVEKNIIQQSLQKYLAPNELSSNLRWSSFSWAGYI